MEKIRKFAKDNGFKYKVDSTGGSVKVETKEDEYFIKRVRGGYQLTIYGRNRGFVHTLGGATQQSIVYAIKEDQGMDDDDETE